MASTFLNGWKKSEEEEDFMICGDCHEIQISVSVNKFDWNIATPFFSGLSMAAFVSNGQAQKLQQSPCGPQGLGISCRALYREFADPDVEGL